MAGWTCPDNYWNIWDGGLRAEIFEGKFVGNGSQITGVAMNPLTETLNANGFDITGAGTFDGTAFKNDAWSSGNVLIVSTSNTIIDNPYLEIYQGGTATSTQVSNAILFCDGSKLTTSAALTYADGSFNLNSDTNPYAIYGYKFYANASSAWNGDFFVVPGHRMYISRLGSAAGGGDLTFDTAISGAMIFTTDNGDIETMRILNNGNVGIGTTTPGFKTSIKTATSNGVSVEGLSIFNPGSGIGTGARIGLGYADNLASQAGIQGYYTNISGLGGTALGIFTGGSATDKVTILENGKVGIGTTAPSANLTVSGALAVQSTLTTSQNGATFLAPSIASGNLIATLVGQALSTGNSVGVDFQYYGNNDSRNHGFFSMYGTQNMSIYQNGGHTMGASFGATSPPANGLIIQGNVGIGTSAPSTNFEVSGAILTSGAGATIDAKQGFKVAGQTGFTGTGAYTNFTISGGIILNAS